MSWRLTYWLLVWMNALKIEILCRNLQLVLWIRIETLLQIRICLHSFHHSNCDNLLGKITSRSSTMFLQLSHNFILVCRGSIGALLKDWGSFLQNWRIHWSIMGMKILQILLLRWIEVSVSILFYKNRGNIPIITYLIHFVARGKIWWRGHWLCRRKLKLIRRFLLVATTTLTHIFDHIIVNHNVLWLPCILYIGLYLDRMEGIWNHIFAHLRRKRMFNNALGGYEILRS
jgi:hypothetical protein